MFKSQGPRRKLLLFIVFLSAFAVSIRGESQEGVAIKQLAQSKRVDYELVIREQEMKLAGKSVKALSINGGIPGPTLKFKVGDIARIKVTNKLSKETTSIHWHGLLVPNKEDGVPYLTTAPIKPGNDHVFEFELKHAGTYWYHSHTGLQEQRGVYGSIVVEALDEIIKVDHEYVLVLSDWTNEKPADVMKTLLRGSEYYAIKKNYIQTISGAYKANALGSYFKRQWSRMLPKDISDVAYDAFLINGKTKSTLKAKPGDRIRLRIINAGASTYFYLNSATGKMNIVAADGQDVEPVDIKRILMGNAETYDVVVTIPDEGAYEFRATAQDGSGFASVFLGSGKEIKTQSPPKPMLYSMGSMAMKDGDTLHSPRPLAPYSLLKARQETTLNPNNKTREITLRLTGDMSRYIWSFNGKTIAEDSTIPVTKGENLRIVLVNETMMHHPIHLHGHFFRLLNKHGAYSPLKHTVDIHPKGKQVIEFEANEEGDWFFHCHILYHMDAGMARVVSYTKNGVVSTPNIDPALLNPWYVMGFVTAQTHMTEATVTATSGRNDFVVQGLAAYTSDNKEFMVTSSWQRYINENLTTLLGYRVHDMYDSKDVAMGGVRYRLPMFVMSTTTIDSEGDLRVILDKEFQLSDHVSYSFELEYDTKTDWGSSHNIDYLLSRDFSLRLNFNTDYRWGMGVTYRF